MKKSILIIFLTLIFLSGTRAANSNISKIYDKGEVSKVELKPCAVKIQGTFDGVVVDLVVTVEATWIECTFFKRGVKKALEKALKE